MQGKFKERATCRLLNSLVKTAKDLLARYGSENLTIQGDFSSSSDGAEEALKD